MGRDSQSCRKILTQPLHGKWPSGHSLSRFIRLAACAGLVEIARVPAANVAMSAVLGQFHNLSLNFVTLRNHSAQKLSKTVRTDPRGVLNVNELKLENVFVRASYYPLPISHLKWQAILGDRKTPKPWPAFGADFALDYRRSGLRLAAF